MLMMQYAVIVDLSVMMMSIVYGPGAIPEQSPPISSTIKSRKKKKSTVK